MSAQDQGRDGEPFENTIKGLLRKRVELIGEMHSIRERMGVLSNDIASLDRVLQVFGHLSLAEEVPDVRSTRLVVFHKSELQQQLLFVLKKADGPQTSRDLAVSLITTEGRDRFDRRLLLDIIKRVGKAMATLRKRGIVIGSRAATGRFEWKLAG